MKGFYSFLLLLALVLLPGFSALAQTPVYGNEWIDVAKTYYKFKTARNGMYRIPKSTLDALGVPSGTAGSQFILYNNGQEVPLYVSNNGPLGSNDYLEFYGTINSAYADRELYPNEAVHANDHRSLFSDSAAYFLTYDNQSNHKRYTDGTTGIPSSPPAAEPWCWVNPGNYYKNAFASGLTTISGYQFQSSAFTSAEGFVESLLPPGSVRSLFLATPNAVAAGGNMILNVAMIATSYDDPHPLKVYVNNQLMIDTTYGQYETRKLTRSGSPSVLSSNTEVRFQGASTGQGYDLWGVAGFDIKYPRNTDLSGLDYFEFQLAPSSSNRYLVFQNFSNGGQAPRLYNLSSGKWYQGDISIAGQTRFYIDPNFTDNNFVLISATSSNYTTFNSGRTVQFTDYSNSSNQGNYVIISNRQLMQPLNGLNYVQEYKNYRSSTAGGSYNVQIEDADQLYDQFAYGVSYHPLAIRHFMQYAYNTWSIKPEYAYIIGRGLLYEKLPDYQQSPSVYTFPLVPAYGDPGSDVDFVNFGPNSQQVINIGRLSAWNNQQVANYLNKVKNFESNQKAAVLPTAATELWKKRVLHIAGASDYSLQQTVLLPTLNAGRDIIKDTSYGGIVTTVAKNNTNPVDPFTNEYVDSIINSGLSLITFHGHASSSGFDYNINDPEKYTNAPELPVLTALGCDIAQIFELSTDKTISERYVDALNGGSIATIAADNLGFTNFHPSYLYALYRSMSQEAYQKTLGDQFRNAYNDVNTQFLNNASYSFYFAHLESMLLQGDPALHLYAPDKPDYEVSDNGISTLPAVVTTSVDSFQLKIVSYNLARAVSDTVHVKVEHISPSGAVTATRTYSIVNLYNTDTSYVWMPLNKVSDIGLNRYRVTIDADNHFDETNETNNAGTLELFIYSDDLIPVYPSEFAIVSNSGLTLKASTLNPFRPSGRYHMELDTTTLFNSPLKQSTTINSAGGVIKWAPNVSLKDSTVYYWRAAFDSTINGSYNWTNSSFIYLAQSNPQDTLDGWNQSHYYQYLRDGFQNLQYGPDRKFTYGQYQVKVEILSKIMGSNSDVDLNKIQINNVDKVRRGCNYNNALLVFVLDSLTGQNWTNSAASASVIGCNPPCSGNAVGVNVFEFNLYNQASRNNARRFIEDSIPNGDYVIVKNSVFHDPVNYPSITWINSPAASWLNDTVGNSGKSLYYTLKNAGFDKLDSLTHMQPFYFAWKKGSNTFPKYGDVGADSSVALDKIFNLHFNLAQGHLESTVIGPARTWKSLKWRTSSPDNFGLNDTARVRVFGIDSNNTSVPLYATANRDTSLSFISARLYPKLRLEWQSYDTINRTSPQLDYWRVLYQPVPEAALNPSAGLTFSDSVQVGQLMNFSVPIENLTPIPMDSMLVRYRVIDASNVTHTLATKRYRKLAGNDTLQASISFDPAPYPGKNQFFVEANPDNDQPEQYHPNNLGYLPFKVITDNRSPVLDVTFDGIHILDRDIISPNPFIKILLKDDNQFLALDDTSAIQVSITYPDEFNIRHRIPIDGTTCKFIPASIQNGKKNEAYIEYRPQFTQRATPPQQNIFTLYVSGKDKSGNQAGQPQGGASTDYQVSFEVVYESSITHVLNYPNPFSTSTAFVFTLTGAQIPSQFKIQILSVTGKVVREITKEELGPIHIGRNITDYHWDGRDQYGQLLGNGVYLYRVVTTINGDDVEHRANDGVDKFFKNGYGKMYIMR